MPAYLIVQSTIKDEAQYQKYAQAVVPFIASFGGKLVARRAKVEVLEGEHDERPVVMFEFPNVEAIAPGRRSQKVRRPSPMDAANEPCSNARRKIAAQRSPGRASETELPTMSDANCPRSITGGE